MSSDVYVVTKGDYSEYRILRIFSTERKAISFKRLQGDEVEVFTLDEANPKRVMYYYVEVSSKGVATSSYKRGGLDNENQPLGHFNHKNIFVIQVIATRKRDAIKVAKEIWATRMAERNGM